MSLATYFPSVQGIRSCGLAQGNNSSGPDFVDAAAPGGLCTVGANTAGTVLIGPSSRRHTPSDLGYLPGINNQGSQAPAGENAPNAMCQKVAGFSATHVFNGLAACKFVGAFSGMYDSSTSTPTRTVTFGAPDGDVPTNVGATINPGSTSNLGSNLFSTLCPLFVGGILLAQDGTCFSIQEITANADAQTLLICNNPWGAKWNSGLANLVPQPFRIYYGGSGMIADVPDPGSFQGVNALAPGGCITTTGLVFGQTLLAPTAVYTTTLDTYPSFLDNILTIGTANAGAVEIGNDTVPSQNLIKGRTVINGSILTIAPLRYQMVAPYALAYNGANQAGSGVTTVQTVIFDTVATITGISYDSGTGTFTITNAAGGGAMWFTFMVTVWVLNAQTAPYITLYLTDVTNTISYALDQRAPVTLGTPVGSTVLSGQIRINTTSDGQQFRVNYQQNTVTTTPSFGGGPSGQFTRISIVNC